MFFYLDYIRATAGDDLLSILRRYVALSKASNGSWLGNDHYTKVLFEFEPDLVFVYFLHHRLQYCDDPRNSSNILICLQEVIIAKTELEVLLKRLNLKDKAKQEILESYSIYHARKQKIVDDFGGERQDLVYKIEELPGQFSSENINWLNFINGNLFQRSQVTEEEEILITNPVLMKELLLLLMESDPQ